MFTKIFCQILDSSIASDPDLRHFFEDLLKVAEPPDGIVDMTPASLAARFDPKRVKITEENVKAWIESLEGPDPDSRTPELEGRRLVRLSQTRRWGWRIVNYSKYRESANREMLRMSEADRKRAYRAKFPPRPHTPTPAEAEAEADIEQSRTSPGQVPDKQCGCRNRPSLEAAKALAVKAGLPSSEGDSFWNYYEANGWRVGLARNPMRSAAGAMANWKRHYVEKHPEPKYAP